MYEFLKATGAPSFDFLYRDGNHDVLPPGKSQTDSTEYGDWMVRMLDHYLADRTPPRIRVLDDLIRLVLGGYGRKEGIGQEEYGILVIDTDGRITRNDTLKVAYPGADRSSSVSSSCNAPGSNARTLSRSIAASPYVRRLQVGDHGEQTRVIRLHLHVDPAAFRQVEPEVTRPDLQRPDLWIKIGSAMVTTEDRYAYHRVRVAPV